MAFDLEALDTTSSSNQGGRMVVMHPVTRKPVADADGNEAYLVLAGIDSDQWAEIDRQIAEHRIERGIQQRNMTVSGDDISEERMAKLVGCTIEVGNLSIGGTPISASQPSTVRAMYERLKWLREDAERFMVDRSNFLPKGSTGSAGTRSTSSVSVGPSAAAGLSVNTWQSPPEPQVEAA